MKNVFYLAVLCSLLSQLPFVLNSGLDVYFKAVWLFPLLIYTHKHISDIFSSKLMQFYFFLFCFFFYCLLTGALTGKNYIGDDIYNALVCCMFTVSSYLFWIKYGSIKVLNRLSVIFLIASLYLSYVVYKEFLVGYSIMSRGYAYDNKNNFAFMLFACILFSLLNFKSRQKSTLILKVVICTVVTIVIFLLKSRATILGLLLCVMYLVFKSQDKYLKYGFMALLSLTVILLVFSSEFYDTFVNGILTAGRDTSDINDLSSNRISIFQTRLSEFSYDNCMYGIGNVYFDSFPIAIMVQYGIIGFSMVFCFLFKVFRFINKLPRTSNSLYLTTFLLMISLLINALFEAYPPFGPGLKCMIFWICYGFCLAEHRKKYFLRNLVKY